MLALDREGHLMFFVFRQRGVNEKEGHIAVAVADDPQRNPVHLRQDLFGGGQKPLRQSRVEIGHRAGCMFVFSHLF